MPTKTMFAALFLLSLFLPPTVKAEASPIMLRCETVLILKNRPSSSLVDVFILEKDMASRVSVYPVQTGTLKEASNAYLMFFPETQVMMNSRYIINRYTGKIEWEFGNPPWGEGKMHNIVRSGLCSPIEDKKVF
jgi:hypothetical protein